MMTDKEDLWMAFNICSHIFQQSGMIKEQTVILSWYEWSGFQTGSSFTSKINPAIQWWQIKKNIECLLSFVGREEA